MNKSAQAMLKSYKNEELLDLLIELKSELSNPAITLAPRQFTEDAEMLEVVQKEILKRMREGSAKMKLIRRCEGVYISADGKYVIYKSGWDGIWTLYENGEKVASFLTKKEAKAEAERRAK